MKKQIITWGLMFAGALALSISCAKEQDMIAPGDESLEPVGVPFELFAGVETKTTTNDDASAFSWAENDKLNVFYRAHGTTEDYSDNNEFTFSSGNSFTGDLASALTADAYDWWALYPYYEGTPSPENTTIGYTVIGGGTQNGNDSKAHLAGSTFPLYGKVLNVAKNEKPTLALKQAMSIIKVHVTNKADDPLTVNSVSVTAPEAISGKFYINFAGESPVFTPATGTNTTSTTATLLVNSGTAIAKNGTADFYLAVKPFTQATTDKLTISINGFEKDVVIPASTEFKPGRIKTVNLEYDKAIPAVTLPWESEEEGGKGLKTAELNAIDGVTVSSDGNYSTGPQWIKFSTTGNSIVIKTDSAIGVASVDVKANGSTVTSQLVFSESVDGASWSEVQTFTIATALISTTNPFNEASRFVKIGFVKKSANAGIGRITISKPATDPVIHAADITNVPAAGVVDEAWTYTASNFVDDVEVADVTGCVSEAIADAGEILYTVTPNYTTTAQNGTIVLRSSADHSVTKTINVAQLKSTLSVSAETVVIPADASVATFTVTTAEFGYTAAVATTEEGKNLSISSGATGTANASAQTVTVSSTTAAPTEGNAITLGTIEVYRTANAADDVQKKTITIKKAVNSGNTVYTITWNSTNNSNGVNNYSSTWAVTAEGLTCNMANWNNNNNLWNYVKCGSKNAASVATIITNSAIPKAIKTVKLTIDSVTASDVKSVKLYISDSTTFGDEDEGSFTIAAGEQSLTIESPAANKYYKIAVDCKKDKNGIFQLSQLVFTTGD